MIHHRWVWCKEWEQRSFVDQWRQKEAFGATKETWSVIQDIRMVENMQKRRSRNLHGNLCNALASLWLIVSANVQGKTPWDEAKNKILNQHLSGNVTWITARLHKRMKNIRVQTSQSWKTTSTSWTLSNIPKTLQCKKRYSRSRSRQL